MSGIVGCLVGDGSAGGSPGFKGRADWEGRLEGPEGIYTLGSRGE